MRVTPPSGRDIPLHFTSGGTATQGRTGDYYFQDPPVLTAGERVACFRLEIVDDARDEPDETIVLALDTARLPSWVTAGGRRHRDPTLIIVGRRPDGGLARPHGPGRGDRGRHGGLHGDARARARRGRGGRRAARGLRHGGDHRGLEPGPCRRHGPQHRRHAHARGHRDPAASLRRRGRADSDARARDGQRRPRRGRRRPSPSRSARTAGAQTASTTRTAAPTSAAAPTRTRRTTASR